jgi:hypothetical protein
MNMPNDDLISRKALLETFEKLKDNPNNQMVEIIFLDGAMSAIDVAPAVDAEPVRRGKWIENYAYGAWHYDCPFCDDGYATKKREKKPENYCHNCGAKMDKEKKT